MRMLCPLHEGPHIPHAAQRLPVGARLDGHAQVAPRSPLGKRLQLLGRPPGIVGHRRQRR